MKNYTTKPLTMIDLEGVQKNDGPKLKGVAVRFWKMVDVRSPDECWEWLGSKLLNGYGQMGVPGRRPEGAHRISFVINKGPIPPGQFVLHHCDNKSCVNPKHLFLGTQADNVSDAKKKNRLSVGERHCISKLTDKSVRLIRADYETGNFSQSQLGKKYKVSSGNIGYITRRHTWRHV